nr:S-layer homology domain-containing protein [Oscillibacter valericigenes]
MVISLLPATALAAPGDWDHHIEIGVGETDNLNGQESWHDYSHKWQSEDPGVASIEQDWWDGSEATVTGVREGETTITHEIGYYYGPRWHKEWSETFHVTVTDNGSGEEPSGGESEDRNVTINKTAVRTDEDSWEVTLTITPKEQIKAEPLRLVLLLDTSGSMAWCTHDDHTSGHGDGWFDGGSWCGYPGEESWKDSRIAVAGNAAKGLLEDLVEAGVNATVSIVTFADDAYVIPLENRWQTSMELSSETLEAIQGKVPTSGAGGGTYMDEGLTAVQSLFNSQDSGKKVLIMLADGERNGPDPTNTANALKWSGVEIYTVGFTTSNETLQNIATQEGQHYYTANTAGQLADVFTQIANGLSALVKDDMGDDVVVDENTIRVQGTSGISNVDSDGTLTWNTDEVLTAGQTVTITYTVELADGVRGLKVGENQVHLNGDAVLTYVTEEDGRSHTLDFPRPTDTVDVGQLTTQVMLGGEVDNNRTTTGGKIIVYEGNDFEWTLPETGQTITVDEGENAVTYTYSYSTYDDETTTENSTPVESGNHTLVHHYVRESAGGADISVTKTLTRVVRGTGEDQVTITDPTSLANMTLIPGDQLTWTITVINKGDAEATGLTLEDELKALDSEGNPDDISRTVTLATNDIENWTQGDTFTVGAAVEGEPTTVTFTATYTVQVSDLGKTLTNSATVNGTGEDTPPTDETENDVDYRVGYFVILPEMIPDSFDPSQGYDPNTYVPNGTEEGQDTVSYNGNDNHVVDNTTGYLGGITPEGAAAVAAEKDGRLEISNKDDLILPEDYGQVTSEHDYTANDIVWYQINSHGLSSVWPNVDPEGKTYQNAYTFHVDGYIPDQDIDVRYYANFDSGNGQFYVSYNDDLKTGDPYTIKDYTNNGEFSFTRPGYRFTGWNTMPDGSGTDYAVGTEFNDQNPLTNSLVLYAQWAEIVPSVDAEKAAALQDDGTIDYTITITYDNADGASQDGMKHIQITDDKLPASAGDVTIQVEDGTNAVSGDPVLENGVLTFTLTQPLSESGTITVSYSFNYLDNSDAIEDSKVTNTATVTVWNENENNGKTDTDTTETEVIYSASDVSKHVVQQNTLIPDEIQDKITGLDITYPDSKQIVANAGETITLLYEISVIGEPGASFNVIEEEGTSYIGAVDSNRNSVEVENFTTIPAQYSGLIPTGSEYVTLYFTKTFSITADTVELTNAATVNGKEVTEEVDVVKPGLYVDKTVKINGKDYEDGMVAKEDDVLTYKITVKNNSNAAITGTVTVSDSKWGSGDGKFSQVQYEWKMADADETVLSGTANVSTGSWQINPRGNDTEFAPGETWTFTYTYTVTAEDVIVGSVSNTVTAESGNGDESTEEVTVPAGSITITPADITIYTGGKGYESVIGNEGATGVPSTGLPEPGYYIELPTALDAALKEALEVDERTTLDLSDYLTFLYDDGNGTTRTWKLERYDDKEGNTSQTSEGRYIYRILPDGTSGIAVRLQFTDGGEITTDDIFALSESNLYQTYSMTIYAGDLNQDLVQAVLDWPDDKDAPHHDVTVGSGELTVRGITDADGEATTTEIVETAPTSEVDEVTAVIDADTNLYINESSLEVADTDSVELLVDSVVSTAVQDLKDSAVDQVSAITDDHEAQFYYLDLVDTDNGNTVVTTKNEPVTLFFPYPEGTDADTAFHIVHYVDQDRDATAESEIAGVNEGSEKFSIEVYSEENQNLETTDQGIKITVTSFSPFGLFWEEDSGSSGGHTGGGGSSRPSRPTLNTEDHYSYIIGYSDGTLQPYGTITRGEVATIFFRLLTDDSREEWWSQVNDYSDCNSDLWCNNAISTLSNMGIIDGFSDGTFRPYAKITRAQFAKIAVGFFETTREDYQGYFTDVDIDAWYTEYVEAAARVGLIEGFNDGTFRPNTNITRAQACVIVNRALGRAPDEDRLLDEDEMITWPDNNPDDWFYADMQEATNSHDYTWTTVSGDKVENWTDKLPQRDWAALEHAWSTAHSAPGGEVTE